VSPRPEAGVRIERAQAKVQRIQPNRGTFHNRKHRGGPGKAMRFVLAIALSLQAAACSQRTDKTLTVLLYSSPVTLHPRNAIDATGQQLGGLLFRALTRLDRDLVPQGDLAERWSVSPNGKRYTFTLREGLSDHEDRPITAELLARCLDHYRGARKAPSRFASAFSGWRATEGQGREVRILLDRPDPYLTKNLTLLRYFRAEGDLEEPCRETRPQEQVVGSGPFKLPRWESAPESEVRLEPAGQVLEPRADQPLRFVFVSDENARALKLLRGDVDAVFNSFSLPRTRWVQRELADRFKVIERDASTVSYLIFNLRDAIVSNKKVRQAIAHAVDREAWVKQKMFGFGTVADSLLHPDLPESFPVKRAYDPALAEKILDEGGFKRPAPGEPRFTLRQKLTSFRESLEQALFLQDSLKKIGIELKLEVVESAVWAESIKRGSFQISLGRLVGVSDGSVFAAMGRSGAHLNRAAYANRAYDQLIERAISEPDSRKRRELLAKAQRQWGEELPYFPLWYWSNGLILRKDLQGIAASDLSLSGSLEPLLKIR
jgi:peptide/nickel transport system substrate-binding protein